MGEDRQGGGAARRGRHRFGPGGQGLSAPRRAGVLLVAAALAGCGDDKPAAETTATQTTTETQSSGAATRPDGLETVVRRCSVSSQRSSTPDVVPIQWRVPKARVVEATRTGEGYTARVLYNHSVTSVYETLRRNAEATGGEIGNAENEGRDAELEIERNGERTEIRLSALRACPQYSQATISLEAG